MLHRKQIKGVVVKEPGIVEIRDDILLPAMADYDVLCKNLAGALCTGTDLSIILGKNNNICYPTILGHESVGRVVAVGKKVSNFKIGDIVTSPRILNITDSKYHSNWGGLCEYGVASDYKKMADDGYEGCLEMYYCNQVVPEGINIADAVMSITWSEIYAYLDRIDLKANDQILILGSGSVALSFLAMLRQRNIQVCIVGNRRHLARFEQLDCSEFIDYADCQATQRLRMKKKSFFDCIIDAVGDKNSVEYYLETLKDKGKLCLYGLKDGKLYEYFKSKANHRICLIDESYSVKNSYRKVFEMIRERKLCWEHWCDKTYELADIKKAIEDIKNKEVMKILFYFPVKKD